MLKSLKRKFLMMTMGLVSLVLLVVFVSMLIGTYGQQHVAIQLSLRQAMEHVPGAARPKEPFGRRAREDVMTTISLLVDAQGNVIISDSDSVDISEEELSQAISAAIAAEGDEGRLRELGLYYMRSKVTPAMIESAAREGMLSDRLYKGEPLPESNLDEALEGYAQDEELIRLAFASDHGLRRALRDLVLTSLMVGLGALVLLFAICLYLADWALRPVERAWDKQRRFISDASHELKTPLTVILADLDIMRRHSGDTIASQSRWLDGSEAEAQRMKGLVEDLLTLARLDEAGQSAPMPAMADIDLSDIVWGSLLTFEPVAFERGLTLDSSISPGLIVRGDEQKLRQLVNILLDNACKYARRRGSVMVTLAAESERASLSVSNTGDAIPPQQLEHLFDRFYRADQSRGGEQSGYGLGLSIAQGIARLHGGSISAASDAEIGNEFRVLLPLASRSGGQDGDAPGSR